MKISETLVDLNLKSIYPEKIFIKGEVIEKIEKEERCNDEFAKPGLIDTHINIESSIVTQGSFNGEAVSRGTIAMISDPHRIDNVMGIDCIKFMISNLEKATMKFYFRAPSCVPATRFET